jgi:hypothetical protein
MRHHRSPELHRRPESANNNSAKQKWRRQPAAGSACRRTRLARAYGQRVRLTPPAPADIIEPPELHRRPEPESANNNPLKRNGDVDQQPYSRLEPVGLRQIGERLARAREGSESG